MPSSLRIYLFTLLLSLSLPITLLLPLNPLRFYIPDIYIFYYILKTRNDSLHNKRQRACPEHCMVVYMQTWQWQSELLIYLIQSYSDITMRSKCILDLPPLPSARGQMLIYFERQNRTTIRYMQQSEKNHATILNSVAVVVVNISK